MSVFYRRRILFSLLVLSYLLFTYHYFRGWWYAAVGSLLIIFFSYLIWGKGFKSRIGLKPEPAVALKSLILAFLFVFGAYMIMDHIAARHHVSIAHTSWHNYFHDAFYVLNEELVLGAILLFGLVREVRIPPVLASVLLAIFFSAVHYVFYRWVFDETGLLEFSTLFTLFLVGFVRNNLILQTGHIGYSWALHFGWMAVMFGTLHSDMDSLRRITEPERFNLYLGSVEMIVISLILAGLSLLLWIRGKNQSLSYLPWNIEPEENSFSSRTK